MMTRRVLLSLAAVAFALFSLPALAEDPPPGQDGVTPAEAPKKKDPFFGDRFAMYLETRGGTASIDTIDNTLDSGARSNSLNSLNFEGNIKTVQAS